MRFPWTPRRHWLDQWMEDQEAINREIGVQLKAIEYRLTVLERKTAGLVPIRLPVPKPFPTPALLEECQRIIDLGETEGEE